MSKIFTTGNADLNTFVKECLELKSRDHILEIGFGPGALIHDMAKTINDGKIEGIDFSETMLKKASSVNKAHITSGKVALHKGDCSSLPFENNYFDKLCSVNTLYFWENPAANLKEILRVVKPAGKVVIGFRDAEQMANFDISKDIFSTYSKEQVVSLLSEAGFSNVVIKEKEGIPVTSYCAIATKP
ncbi:MAG: class I SAM-dependent methyltransferase [Cellvibrionaceae bacterium]